MNLKQNNTTTKHMENNKTAVEWLHEIAKQREPDKFDWEQAKQIEKQQIIDAWIATDNELQRIAAALHNAQQQVEQLNNQYFIKIGAIQVLERQMAEKKELVQPQ